MYERMNKKLEDIKERCLRKMYELATPGGDYTELRRKYGDRDPAWPMVFSMEQGAQLAVIAHVCKNLGPEDRRQIRNAIMLGDAPCVAPPYFRSVPTEQKLYEFIMAYGTGEVRG